MSLDDEQTQASITAYEAALNLFTDRIPERRLFADYLNDDPPKNTILFFHGDGGNGKSWLLRILRERYCKQLPPASWAYVREQEDGKAFIAHFEGAEDFKPVPHAYLDFADINHDNPPRDAFHGPRLLRKQLGRQGLSFPCMTLRCCCIGPKAGANPAPSTANCSSRWAKSSTTTPPKPVSNV